MARESLYNLSYPPRFGLWRSRSWSQRIRHGLLVPGSWKWNAWVRDFTAWMERAGY